VCVNGLVPGRLYYVLVGAKIRHSTAATYKVTIGPANCDPPVVNDYCLYAQAVADGTTSFDLGTALPDGLAEPCFSGMKNDLWYDYTATCTGTLVVEACGANAETSPDTNLAIYDDCRCPPVAAGPAACSADAGGDCGYGSRVAVTAVEGRCYKIRLGDSGGNRPSGQLSVRCEPIDCLEGPIVWLDPPSGVVDARRPHRPDDAAALEGIEALSAALPPGDAAECLVLCETRPGETPNAIAEVLAGTLGTRTVRLARPITAGAKTVIRFDSFYGYDVPVRLASHPGNVNADGFANEQDMADLVAAFCDPTKLPFGRYSVSFVKLANTRNIGK
jgi:hypothetical protein